MKRLFFWMGIDRTIFIYLLSRGWSVIAGVVSLYFISTFLTPEVQGYYYAFYSLIGMQIFLEMGLNFAIIQFASHEMAHLAWDETGRVSGSQQGVQRLKSLFRFAATWFSVAAIIMILLLLPLGLYFFSETTQGNSPAGMGRAWSMLVVVTAINVLISSAVSILEGCGKVEEIASMRAIQLVITTFCLWGTLMAGGGLFALPASALAGLLVAILWMWRKFRPFYADMLNYQTGVGGIHWKQEIWPFQWRVAISSMSGYFISQAFTPILFAFHGPTLAGQMGMSMQIINTINGMAFVWITSKMPIYGKLVAAGKRRELEGQFLKATVQSFVALVAAALFVGTVLFMLTENESAYTERVLPVSLFTILLATALVRHLVFAEASFLRAHKKDPFMLLSVAVGVATGSLALIFIPAFGAAGAVYPYFFSLLIIGFGVGSLIFQRKRKEWTMSDGMRGVSHVE